MKIVQLPYLLPTTLFMLAGAGLSSETLHNTEKYVSLFLILLGLISIATLFVATFLPIALGYKIAVFSFILGIPAILFSLDFIAKWFGSKKKS